MSHVQQLGEPPDRNSANGRAESRMHDARSTLVCAKFNGWWAMTSAACRSKAATDA
ncbi:hypothetical protein [Saccharothrix deserti]|uniref:hypothetical protein n=1 Tax=Saccharothrix deserti TaxID=2593674 RepID=UPI00131B72CF|nr:hypothetical protein [Saccharothrix deserti]